MLIFGPRSTNMAMDCWPPCVKPTAKSCEWFYAERFVFCRFFRNWTVGDGKIFTNSLIQKEEIGVGSGGRTHVDTVNKGLNWTRIAQKVLFGGIWTLIAHALHTLRFEGCGFQIGDAEASGPPERAPGWRGRGRDFTSVAKSNFSNVAARWDLTRHLCERTRP